jgi:sulfotransferase family protein
MSGPIFLAGPSRSGKTLMRWILSTHPRIAVSRRTELWPRFAERFGDLARPENLDRCLAAMARRSQIAALGVDLDELREVFVAGDTTYPRLFALLHERYAARLGKTRWGDQSPGNERFADEVMAAYPDARFLHLVRDPRDVVAAERERRPGRPGVTGAATTAWLRSIRLAERNAERHAGAYLLVRYEALVADPAGVMREACTFLDEAFDPTMTELDGVERYRDIEGGAISTAFVFAYRRTLEPWDVAAIQRAAACEMMRLGYRPDAVDLSTIGRIRCAAAWPLGLTRTGLRRSASALGRATPGGEGRDR